MIRKLLFISLSTTLTILLFSSSYPDPSHLFYKEGQKNQPQASLAFGSTLPASKNSPPSHFNYLPLVFRTGFGAPVLKWQRGGCTSWCETGWYSSPALVDVNGDGKNEVIASAYSLWALNGETGVPIWTVNPPGDRTWPGIVVADVDLDNAKEIVIAQGSGYVVVYRLNGTIKYQARPTTSELRGLLVADLDGNNSTLEIVVTAAIGSKTNTWVYNSSLTLRSGWPQLSNNNGYAAGVYNANLAAANLDPADARLELVTPNDTHYITAYKPDGTSLAANTTTYPSRAYWGLVGVWENLAVEQRGWGQCSVGYPRAENYRPNFAGSPATIADVNRDGQREVVATGNVYDCSDGSYPSKYMGVFIFNKDRTRFNTGGYDWRSTPQDTGAFLSEDYNLIENVQPNPVVADLDGDGKLEILYPSYDGRLHAFWLDKTEHGSWPFAVYKPGDSFYRFASEPAIVDIDNDGQAEVIFTSWVQKGSNQTGKLYIVSSLGKLIYETTLPLAFSGDWNGALPAPTLGNVDSDPDLEIVINSALSGVLVYDLPSSSGARILWGTGRGNYQRNAGQ